MAMTFFVIYLTARCCSVMGRSLCSALDGLRFADAHIVICGDSEGWVRNPRKTSGMRTSVVNTSRSHPTDHSNTGAVTAKETGSKRAYSGTSLHRHTEFEIWEI